MAPVMPFPWQQLYRWPCLINNKIPRFYPKQRSSTHNNLIGRVKATWGPCVCWARPSVPLQKIAYGDIWFFTERDWSREWCHGNDIVGFIIFLLWFTFLVPRLKNTAPIFLEISLIECCTAFVEPHITSSFSWFALIIQKRKYLYKEKRYSQKENAILLYFGKPFK